MNQIPKNRNLLRQSSEKFRIKTFFGKVGKIYPQKYCNESGVETDEFRDPHELHEADELHDQHEVHAPHEVQSN
ncbi:hypothetical protein BCV71DRAFT_268140 [Rhizopus microsporus]|uniref:Uncharacterized protein n=1 Tax=Rhizopus microsporus TaxID=58291 RepID=A0A1X0RNM6_RHIZD|nr:hypothetical protein BCV71DRAFT_268140 [Rhizopus microsporus]